MGSKSAPAAPDYDAYARETAAANKELTAQQNWANRPDQYTPWGQSTWNTVQTIDPGTGQPVTRWQQTQSIVPQLQDALYKQIGMQSGRTDLASSFMGRVASEMGNQPFNWNAINAQAPRGQAINAGNYTTTPTPGTVQKVNEQTLDTTAPTQTTTGHETLGTTGQDTQGLASTTATSNQANFVNERARIEGELFKRMQPEHDRQTAAMTTQLANQGITPGSEAYKQQMQTMQDQQARERFNAVQQGGQEQQNQQNMLMGQQQQAFGQTQASQAARNAALQNLFGQQQGAATFGLGAGQQGFQQDLAAQQAGNAAKQAMFQQALQSGQFTNQALQQMFGQQSAANSQNYSQAMNSSQYQNQLRQQAIAEEAQRRNMSLNEMNALMTGQQVQSPQMPGFNANTKSEAANLLGAAQMTNQSNMDQFNSEQQQMQGMMSGIMGLGKGASMM